MRIELWKLSDIKPYPGNPRQNAAAIDGMGEPDGDHTVLRADVVEHEVYRTARGRLSRTRAGPRSAFVGARGALGAQPENPWTFGLRHEVS